MIERLDFVDIFHLRMQMKGQELKFESKVETKFKIQIQMIKT